MANKQTTENKAANAAPESKPNQAQENKDSGTAEKSDEPKSDTENKAANDAPNARGLTEADLAATDHSDAVDMVFLKDGSYDLVGGARIVGKKGDHCALKPDDAKAAVESGLMAEADHNSDEAE